MPNQFLHKTLQDADQWAIIISSWVTIGSVIYAMLTVESEEMIKARNEKIRLEKLRK